MSKTKYFLEETWDEFRDVWNYNIMREELGLLYVQEKIQKSYISYLPGESCILETDDQHKTRALKRFDEFIERRKFLKSKERKVLKEAQV